jgi:hypothetical protein
MKVQRNYFKRLFYHARNYHDKKPLFQNEMDTRANEVLDDLRARKLIKSDADQEWDEDIDWRINDCLICFTLLRR